MVEEKFIIKLQGKEFITFEGLLNEFHKNGGKEINTEIISTEPFIIKATASGQIGTFSGIGDADENNVNSMINKHKIRMAETRAIARALRWYNNIGMCAAEELGEPKAETFGEDIPIKNDCYDCGTKVQDVVKDFSLRNFNKVLCRDCQRKNKESKSK